MRIFILDGNEFSSQEAAHDYIARVFRFPDYYGKNLDALFDLLTEYDNHTHVIILHPAIIRKNLGGYGEAIINTFEDASGGNGLHLALDGE